VEHLVGRDAKLVRQVRLHKAAHDLQGNQKVLTRKLESNTLAPFPSPELNFLNQY
jgi:hypothetical protein